jgi:hypothetical protein
MKKKKLSLSRETLRQLDLRKDGSLKIAGGIAADYSPCTCGDLDLCPTSPACPPA